MAIQESAGTSGPVFCAACGHECDPVVHEGEPKCLACAHVGAVSRSVLRGLVAQGLESYWEDKGSMRQRVVLYEKRGDWYRYYGTSVHLPSVEVSWLVDLYLASTRAQLLRLLEDKARLQEEQDR